MNDPARHSYRDIAITPPDLDELKLGLYAETRGTAEAIEKQKRETKIRIDARARAEHRDTAHLEAAE
jgi:hypothetical protein